MRAIISAFLSDITGASSTCSFLSAFCNSTRIFVPRTLPKGNIPSGVRVFAAFGRIADNRRAAMDVNSAALERPIMHRAESNAIELPVPILRKHGITLLEGVTPRSANGAAPSSFSSPSFSSSLSSSLISMHPERSPFSRLKRRRRRWGLLSDLFFVTISSFLFHRRANALLATLIILFRLTSRERASACDLLLRRINIDPNTLCRSHGEKFLRITPGYMRML